MTTWNGRRAAFSKAANLLLRPHRPSRCTSGIRVRTISLQSRRNPVSSTQAALPHGVRLPEMDRAEVDRAEIVAEMGRVEADFAALVGQAGRSDLRRRSSGTAGRTSRGTRRPRSAQPAAENIPGFGLASGTWVQVTVVP